MKKIVTLAVTALFLIAPGWARAYNMPVTNLSTTPLVTPSSAWTYYGAATLHSNTFTSNPTPPEISALARSLGASRVGQPSGSGGITADDYAQRVYDYIRNNIAIEFRFGLSKGARGALIDQSGTAFDQAELMAKLLRQAGITANYQVGTISLTAQQFGQWTGLIKGLNVTTQTFTVSAQAACQMLADGAIPATVGGATSCTGVTGDLASTGTPITMAHIWVVANGKIYDPAYKKYTFKAGVDLAAALGCGTASAPTCGSSANTAAMSGSTAGTIGGAPSITHVNESGLTTNLNAKAQNLQTYVQTNMVQGELADLVGGKKIDRTFAPTPGSTSMFPSVAQYTWTGDIPDQFRTTLRVRFASFDATAYADDVAGKRIRIYGYPDSSTPNWVLYVESTAVAAGNCTTCMTNEVILNVNHPYSAASGTYADEQAEFFLDASAQENVPPITIVDQFGAATESTEQYYANLQKADPDPVFLNSGYGKWDPSNDICGGSYYYNGNYVAENQFCRNDSQPTFIAKVVAQGSTADRILEQTSDSIIQRHHTIGIIASQGTSSSSSDLLSLQSDASVASQTNDATSRQASFETASAVWGMIEGSAAQQLSDVPMPDSTAGLFTIANRNGIPFVSVTSTNLSTVLPSLSGYTGVRGQRLQAAAANGFNAILPQTATAGSVSYSGITFTYLIGGDLFYKSNALGYMIDETYKGGAAADGPDDPAISVLKSAQQTDYALNPKKYLTVSTATGDLSLAPPPDLVTGTGDFPHSLPLQRGYRSNNGVLEAITTQIGETDTNGNPVPFFKRYWAYEGADQNVYARLGGGWTHNFDISAVMSNSAMKAMSPDSALGTTPFVAGLYTLYDTLKNTTFQNRLTAAFEAEWLDTQFFHNAVTVDVGGKVEMFGRLPDGTFLHSPGSASKLVQSGTPVGPRVLDDQSYGVGYDYMPVTFVYTDRDGSQITFDWAVQFFEDQVSTYGHPIFKADTWTFPAGEKLTFSYDYQEFTNSPFGGVFGYLLTGVSSNLGRSLTFTNEARYTSDDPETISWRVASVQDETGRTVTYLPDYCPQVYTFSQVGTTTIVCNRFTATSTTVASNDTVSTYTYDAESDSPDPVQIVRPLYRLRRWYTPANQTSPIETVAYDDLYRVQTITDALSHVTQYFSGRIGGGEVSSPAEVLDPLNASTRFIYDEKNNLLSVTDPLSRTTSYAYDDVGRLVKTSYPEGNGETRTYDVRSNLLSVTRTGKLGGTATTSTAYVTGPTVTACATPATCNKPASTTNARGKVTNYTWNSITGQMSQVQQPADSDGVRPTTTYSYTAMGPTGSQFYQLTSKTETVTPTSSLVTTYAYNASNKYVPQSSTVDPSGLNLTTSYTFDAIGNLTAVDGPRTDVSDVTTYAWDPMRRLTYRFDPDPDGAGALLFPTVKNTYDLDGKLTMVEKGKASTAVAANFTAMERTEYAYNAVGLKTQATVRNGVTTSALALTQYAYDADDRLLCTAVRMNAATFGSPPADACTLGTAGSDGNDRITRITYDAAGQTTIETRAYGTSLAEAYATDAYTPNGKLQTVKDANGNLSTYTYDEFDRLAQLNFPNTDPAVSTSSTTDYETYGYDAADNQISVRRRDGQVINYQYDDLNRQILKDIPSATATDVYTRYDHRGRPKFEHFASLTGTGVDYAYDLAGRLTGETDSVSGRTLSYQYDQAGDRARVTWPDGFYAAYAYDADNRVTSVKENGTTQLALYAYDDLGRRTTITRASTADQTTYGYDGASRLTSLTHNIASTANDVTFTLARNAAGQISSTTTSTGVYDWTPPGGSSTNNTYDGLNRDAAIAAVSGGYDARGNLTFDGTRTLTYDVENRLLSVTGSPGVSLAYDPLGRLHQTTAGTTVTQFLYSGDDLSAEYDGSGNLLRRYVQGPGVDEPLVWYEGSGTTDKRWLHADMRGSVIFTANASGTLTYGPYKYGSYGEPASWSGSRFSYTGQIMLPEAKLYHYKARAYDPATGRFMQSDPVGYDDDLDLYAYAGEDPINAADPTGEAGEAQAAGTVDEVVVWGSRAGQAASWLDSWAIDAFRLALDPTLEPLTANDVMYGPNGWTASHAKPTDKDKSKEKQKGKGKTEETPDTDPDKFKPVKGRPGKENTETGEVWEKDRLHKDHYEVYRDRRRYEQGVRDRDVWSDGRPKGKF